MLRHGKQAFGVQAFSLKPDPRARKLLGKGDALATSAATVLLWREVVDNLIFGSHGNPQRTGSF